MQSNTLHSGSHSILWNAERHVAVMAPMRMCGSDVIVTWLFKQLEPANQEGRAGEDRIPGSGDSVPLEGLILKVNL